MGERGRHLPSSDLTGAWVRRGEDLPKVVLAADSNAARATPPGEHARTRPGGGACRRIRAASPRLSRADRHPAGRCPALRAEAAWAGTAGTLALLTPTSVWVSQGVRIASVLNAGSSGSSSSRAPRVSSAALDNLSAAIDAGLGDLGFAAHPRWP